MGTVEVSHIAQAFGRTQAVVDEKENRTIEILLTSVSANQMLAGKVLGIVAVNLTQVAAWVLFAFPIVLGGGSLGVAWFQDVWSTPGQS